MQARPIGFITVFPQLAVMMGLIKRLTFGRFPILAWCFNLGQAYGGAKGYLAGIGLARIDVFTVHSTMEAAIYAQWLGISRSRLIFVPLSVACREPSKLRQTDEPFILALGTANRDYRLLLAALAHGDWPAVVVSGLHALEGLEIPVWVTVRSGLSEEECRALSERAQIQVIPLHDSATAAGQVTLIEAMMLGRAVIATKCCGTVDYVKDGVTGLLVPPGDADALRTAISRLWNDGALRKRLGEAARQAALAHYTFRHAAGLMQAVLDQLEETCSRKADHLQRRRVGELPPKPGPAKP